VRVVFAGTPDIAVPSLQAVAQSRHALVAVVTQPDRQRGRRRHLAAPPVKKAAIALHVPVMQPADVNVRSFVARLAALRPDAMAVIAFGQRLSPRVLGLAPRGCFNLHASLLPRLRGAAPVTWAIVRGETETGVTVIRMSAKMDAGDMVLQRATQIGRDETAGELTERLARVGASALVEALDRVADGTATFTPQDSSQATRAPRLTKADGWVDWTREAAYLACFVRGMTPWPGAFTCRRSARGHQERVTILRLCADAAAQAVAASDVPGTVLGMDKQGILVRAGDGPVRIERLRPAGKRDMAADEYARGRAVRPGERFFSGT